jgi:multidrug efflux system outer membrane protein
MREVSDALVAREQLTRQVALLQQQVAAVSQQLDLAQLRYQGGTANYLEVTVAEENLLPVQLALARSRANQLGSVVQLYRALGGGWQQSGPPSKPAPPPHSPPYY